MRELEIEFRGTQRRFDGRHLRGGLLRERGAAIVLLVRHRVLGLQPLGALQFRLRALDSRLRAVQLGAQPIDFRLERTLIDLEQQLPAADDGAFVEVQRLDVARHTRPDRRRCRRLRADR